MLDTRHKVYSFDTGKIKQLLNKVPQGCHGGRKEYMEDQLVSITLTLDRDGFGGVMQHLLRNARDLSPVSYEIGQLLSNSVKRNFTEGGRPEKWKQSKRATDNDGQTLRDTVVLMNAIIGGDVGDNRIRVGTNVVYAVAHHFGVAKQITQQVGQHIRRITQAFEENERSDSDKRKMDRDLQIREIWRQGQL